MVWRLKGETSENHRTAEKIHSIKLLVVAKFLEYSFQNKHLNALYD
jgi:hypothetical protein